MRQKKIYTDSIKRPQRLKMRKELNGLQQKANRRSLRNRAMGSLERLTFYIARYNLTKRFRVSAPTLSYLIHKADLSKISKRGSILAMFFFAYNKEEALNLSPEDIDYVIKNSDLQRPNRLGVNLFQYALHYNAEAHLFLNNAQWDLFLKKGSISQNCNVSTGNNSLQLFFINYKKQLLNLSAEQIDYLIDHSDLNHRNLNNSTALDIALNNTFCSELLSLEHWYKLLKGTQGKYNPINSWNKLPPSFGFEEIDYLLHNIDLNQRTGNDWLPVMSIMASAPSINLTVAQWDYVLQNTNLAAPGEKERTWSTLVVALYHREYVSLTQKQWEYFIAQCPLDIKPTMLISTRTKQDMISFLDNLKAKREKQELESQVLILSPQSAQSKKTTPHKI